MEAISASALSQAQSLRALCAEYAHGARRDAFISQVDGVIDTLFDDHLRITVVLTQPVSLDAFPVSAASPVSGVAGAAQWPLSILSRNPADAASERQTGETVRRLGLSEDAFRGGIASIQVVHVVDRVFASPALLGHLVGATDLVVVCGALPPDDKVFMAGLTALAEACDWGLHLDSGVQGASGAAAQGATVFKHWEELPRWGEGVSLLTALGDYLTVEFRRSAILSTTWSRLAQTADALQKEMQPELAMLKFRSNDLVRLRKGEDAGAGDIKEQADTIKSLLDQWTAARKDEIVRSNEDGVLPFDARLLATKLTIDHLILRQEQSAAETKYPFLKAAIFQGLVSHRYTVVPDPGVIDGIRSRMVNALDVQVRKDLDLLNQQSGELMDRLRRSAELYPIFSDALKEIRLPVLQRASFDRPLNSIAVEAEIEDSHTHLGLFKRLAEGRMFASMAFSFVTMAAGVFVLFGEPSIKRGLMKFSGVIVIVMVLYFVFSMLVKGEEEKKSLEEKLEKIREQVNQAVQRPLGKAEQGIVKVYQAFVDEVKFSVATSVDVVLKRQVLAKARLAEQRKSEDDLTKGFLQRRQQSAGTLVQKLQQYAQVLERARSGSERPAGPSVASSSAVSPMRSFAATKAASTEAVASETAVDHPTTTRVSPPASPVLASSSAARPAAPVRSAAMDKLAALAKLGPQRSRDVVAAKDAAQSQPRPASVTPGAQEGTP
jgi:hypothetical protein